VRVLEITSNPIMCSENKGKDAFGTRRVVQVRRVPLGNEALFSNNAQNQAERREETQKYVYR
jgi:hypothetical protein